jgi:hypothetical protein
VTDAAGNSNPDSASFTRTYDSARPTVVLSTSAGSATNLAVIPLTITFSESVSGLEINDLLVSTAAQAAWRAAEPFIQPRSPPAQTVR